MKIEELLSDVWPDWEIDEQIGRGANGRVYKIHKMEKEIDFYSALKVISIPEDSSEAENLRYEGFDEEQTKNYFAEIVSNVIQEVKLLSSLRGAKNIVRIEDYKVVEHAESQSWDILIRMELLTPLNEFLCDKKLSESEVIKLGIDMCDALTLCHENNIIHRDIKPENIFVNEFGDYKIGDFGIAKQMEELSYSMSQKGTYGYVAPEVLASKSYDLTVDIYSLGIVLYKIFNNNRLPFLDPNKQILNASERHDATERRLRGETIPLLSNVSEDISKVIVKSCEFDPLKRYESAKQFKEALQNVGKQSGISSISYKLDENKSDNPREKKSGNPSENDNREQNELQPEKQKETLNQEKEGGKDYKVFIATLIVFILAAGIVVFGILMKKENNSNAQTASSDDSSSMVNEKKSDEQLYQEASDLINEKMYHDALSIFDEMTDYGEYEEARKECILYAGLDYLVEGNFEEGSALLNEIIYDYEYLTPAEGIGYTVETEYTGPDYGDDTQKECEEEKYLYVYELDAMATKSRSVHFFFKDEEGENMETLEITWYWMDADDEVDNIYIDIYDEGPDYNDLLGSWLVDKECNVLDSYYTIEDKREQRVYDHCSK